MSSSSTDQDSPSLVGTSLPSSMQKALPKLYNYPLQPVDVSFGLVRPLDTTASVGEIARKMAPQSKRDVSIIASVAKVFRKPGCALCREQGQELSAYVRGTPDVNIWGVVCETGKYDDELLELREKYFYHPFFKDGKKSMYKALGDKEIGHPGRNMLKRIEQRLRAKNIPRKDPGLGQNKVLGGIIIFDSKGYVRFAMQENPWEGPDMKAIQDVIECIRLEHKEDVSSSLGSSSLG